MLYTRFIGLSALALTALGAQSPVILISIDTLRADRVGAKTPGILEYAQGGTTFTAAETQIPFTLPSHTALLTSTYPFENGVEENAGHVPANLKTAASQFHDRGYATGAFIGSIFLERELGLDRGFDTYDSPFHFEAFSKLSGSLLFAGGPHNPYSVRERRPGALVTRAAVQWLAQHKGQPVFAFIHLFDVHKPYALGSYDAEVAYVDKLLAGFAAALKREGWWDVSTIAITADHGEGLGEHGESDHGYFVYESTLHVPLIVHWPKSRSAPARIDDPIGLIDVMPMILSGEVSKLVQNKPVVSESTYGRDCFGWAPLRAIREGAMKYIEAPRPELYNLANDPGETRNLVSADRRASARLREDLNKIIAGRTAKPVQQTGDPQTNKEVLRSLGYLAPGPRASPDAPADPKDKLPELLGYEDALDLMEERRYDAAIAKLRRIVATDPHNLLARRDLGVALIEIHKYTAAAAELKQVAAVSGDDYVTRYELGVAEEGLGHPPEALSQFEAACLIAPAARQCRDKLAELRAK